ncbi:alpha/beta fold hydrolase [Halopseudomonas nanhaiensis]|uniref:alpha/beta hydrolase family protein n=1 Tax=Halopseudomonas nanhaiensis TaxID=2830842 RepID=UPI001CC0879A|nr:prolyl oligopeptidase family serine peptidase [Halopseudomonas nanhaiensis]UAW97413.1 alpha/beta fold hydrolase [Halopseudomonas nanhaiensis]
MRRFSVFHRPIWLLALMLSGACAVAQDSAALQHPSDYLRVTNYPGGFVGADRESWREAVEEVEDIEIPSSADGAHQKALFYDSGSDRDKPLLLVLHSWSTGYLQNIDIPLAEFARANDWVFMHPDFRGANTGDPDTTASEMVLSDMHDALQYARDNANVDPSRIYLLGYSGGAMNALHLARMNPDVFAGTAIWVPVYDLVDWYEWNASRGEKYAGEIEGACGGNPLENDTARQECRKRSPSTYMSEVAGKLPILIAHGIDDETVPPDYALRAFNDLAKQGEGVDAAAYEQLRSTREVPDALRSRHVNDGDLVGFESAEADVLLHMKSGPVELVLFEGEHDMLYRPGLEWLARQRRD